MAAAGERFLVLLGPGVSDQAAIPLPFVSNPVSPSLTALLRRELERRGGPELAERLLATTGDAADPARAPARLRLLLRALAADDEARDELLGALCEGKRPGVAHRALAGLIAAGKVRRVVSTCWDPLLEWTLEQRRVGHELQLGAEPPAWEGTVVWRLGLAPHITDPAPVAATELVTTLGRAAERGGLLLVGHAGLLDPVAAAAVALARDAARLPHGVTWVQDDDQLSDEAPRALAEAAGDRFRLVRRPETADLLAELAAAEGVALGEPPPAYVATRTLERLSELLDREIEMEGILGAIPVIGLYEPILERIPAIRIRSALLLLLGIAGLFAAWNAWEWRGREAVVDAQRAALDGLAADLAARPTIEATLDVARRTDELVTAVDAIELDREGEASVSAVIDLTQARLDALKGDVRAFRDEALLLARARRGLERALRFDERFDRFNRFPAPAVRELGGAATVTSLADALARPALVLVAQRELTLEVLFKRSALADLEAREGPLPLLLELSALGQGGIEALALDALARAAGVPAASVDPTLVAALLDRGALRLLGRRPGGALRRTLFAAERFRAEHPATPLVVAVAGLPAGLALPLPAVAVEPLRAADALAYAATVSPRLRPLLASRRDLLAAATDPLSLSITVDHFLSSGGLPRSRGLLLDAFVTEYLEQQVQAGVGGRLGLRAYGLKRLLAELGEWAASPERRAAPALDREEATRHLAAKLDQDEPYGLLLARSPPDPQLLRRTAHETGGPGVGALSAGEAALEALLATGLLEATPDDGALRFATDELRAYACATHLRSSSGSWQELDSDEQPGAVALFAQQQPDPAAQFTSDRSAWRLVPEALETVHAAAEAMGGVATPDPALEAQVLEQGLQLLDHPVLFRRRQGATILRALGTPPVVRALLLRARAAEDRASFALSTLAGLPIGDVALAEVTALALDAARPPAVRAAATRALVAASPDVPPALAALLAEPPAVAAAPAEPALAEARLAARWDESMDPAPLLAALGRLGRGPDPLAPAALLPAYAHVRDPRVLAALVDLAVAVPEGGPEPEVIRRAVEALATSGDLVALQGLYPLAARLVEDDRLGAKASRDLLLALARAVTAILDRQTPAARRTANQLLERFEAPWRSLLQRLVDGQDDELGTAAGEACVRLAPGWVARTVQ